MKVERMMLEDDGLVRLRVDSLITLKVGQKTSP
jgi:hypothetical protein